MTDSTTPCFVGEYLGIPPLSDSIDGSGLDFPLDLDISSLVLSTDGRTVDLTTQDFVSQVIEPVGFGIVDALAYGIPTGTQSITWNAWDPAYTDTPNSDGAISAGLQFFDTSGFILPLSAFTTIIEIADPPDGGNLITGQFDIPARASYWRMLVRRNDLGSNVPTENYRLSTQIFCGPTGFTFCGVLSLIGYEATGIPVASPVLRGMIIG